MPSKTSRYMSRKSTAGKQNKATINFNRQANANIARAKTRTTKSASRQSGSQGSSGGFRPTDMVPQWNLFRQISNRIRKATGK